MRIAVGCMMHETNTFTHLSTGITAFTLAQGRGVYAVDAWRGTVSFGILDTLEALGAQVVPLYFARALSSGLVRRAAFEEICGEMVRALREAAAVDGICLALHGSMCAEGYDDSEGELLRRLRTETGPDTPIVCALDMHATMTQDMAVLANGYTAYRTAPHIDEYETGQAAARLLVQSVAEKRRLQVAYRRLPILIAGEQTETDVQPMRGLMAELEQTEKRVAALHCAYLLGFPWADSPYGGVSAVVTGYADTNPKWALAATHLADRFWQQRGNFTFTTEAYPLEEALRRADAVPGSPVIISDSGDNPTAGAACDLCVVAQALLRRKHQSALVAVIADSAASAACRAGGEGAVLPLSIGRVQHGSVQPLECTARVLRLAQVDAVFYAVVDVEGLHIAVTDKRTAVFDPALLQRAGVDLSAYRLIVVKSGYQSPEYRAIAAHSLIALTPGDTSELLTMLPYARTPRPMFPLDDT